VADHKKGGEGGKKKPTRPPPAPSRAATSARGKGKPAAERVRPGALKGSEEPAPGDKPGPFAPAAARAAAVAGVAGPRRRHVRSDERPVTVLRLRFQAVPFEEAAPAALEEGVAKVGHTDDISMGGAFVLSAVLPPIGARIALELDLASTWQPLVVLGEVRWHKKDPRGFGVAFVDLPARAHVALGQLLTTLSFKD